MILDDSIAELHLLKYENNEREVIIVDIFRKGLSTSFYFKFFRRSQILFVL